MDFRRARVASFLAPWARDEKVELFAAAPSEARAKLLQDIDCRMVVYDVGGINPSSSEILAEIRVLDALRPSAALVVLTDDDGNPDSVISTIAAGAQGYLSSSMGPELALLALTFILRGGTYFPPTAILGKHAGSIRHSRTVNEFPRESSAQPPPPVDQMSASPAETRCDRQQGPLSGGAEVCAVHNDQGSVARPPPRPDAVDPPVASQANTPHSTTMPRMTDRQQGVLACLCEGDPNKVIGRKLGMPETTVKVHVREIMRKLGVGNRTQVAIVAAARFGIVTGEVQQMISRNGGAPARPASIPTH